MTSEQQVDALVRATFGEGSGAFRASAVFDEPLDCIRVVARDCSVTETRVSEIITVLEDSYWVAPRGRRYVGFTIKGAKHFCKEQGFNLSTPIRLTEILDRILATFPDVSVRLAVDAVARPLVEEIPGIERIDLPGGEPAAETA